MTHAAKTDRDYLRQVEVDGYALRTWQTGKRYATGQERLGYEFVTPEGIVLFHGEDFGCSPMDCIDSDAALRGILGFLTLKPGDTDDDDYFANYTPEQMAFAEGDDVEYLSLWSIEPDDDYEQPAFVNLDDWIEEEEITEARQRRRIHRIVSPHGMCRQYCVEHERDPDVEACR